MPEKWANVNKWTDAAERAASSIENAHVSVSNGSLAWMRANTRRNAPRYGKFILPEVQKVGQDLSNQWRRIYRESELFLQWQYEERGLTGRQTASARKMKMELQAYQNQLRWQKIDSVVSRGPGFCQVP